MLVVTSPLVVLVALLAQVAVLARGVDVAVAALVALAVALLAAPLVPLAVVVVSSVALYRVVSLAAISLLTITPLLVLRTWWFRRALTVAPKIFLQIILISNLTRAIKVGLFFCSIVCIVTFDLSPCRYSSRCPRSRSAGCACCGAGGARPGCRPGRGARADIRLARACIRHARGDPSRRVCLP